MINMPVIVLGVWSGWQLHDRLNQVQLYRACYALLIVVALKLPIGLKMLIFLRNLNRIVDLDAEVVRDR